MIDCSCPVCTSSDSRDKRLRCSLYVEGNAGERAVIDTGPEFRLQALRVGITGLDAVFLSHAHADHIHGLDDIRPLSREKSIPLYGNSSTIAEFYERFSYIFKTTQRGGGKPHIEPITVNGPVQLGGLVFVPIPVKHGTIDILGWKIIEPVVSAGAGDASGNTGQRIGRAVYMTDCSHIDEDEFTLIAEDGPPEAAIIGGLRVRPHETHFSFEQAINAAVRMGAKQVYLTHICHDHSHREIEDYCRDFERKLGLSAVTPAWDGLKLEL